MLGVMLVFIVHFQGSLRVNRGVWRLDHCWLGLSGWYVLQVGLVVLVVWWWW